METVVAFNSELSGLYDSKPPISKAKMAAITRAAMKAIKFYKHVVQSVEKFILKCKPEYKIPGLYVIDSIVRQSRHQFGAEKDVFAPRFARNMKQTFANLFRCAPEDKSRIIRVLNLWQKNSVFAPEVIQPLFDLADPNNPIYQIPIGAGGVQDVSNSSNGLNTSGDGGTPNMDDSHGMSVDLTAASGHQTANTLDQSTIRQLQQLQQILIRQTNETASSGSTGANQSQSDSVKFNKKLLDYDYGDDEEEDKSTSPHVPNLLDGNNLTQLLKDPNVLRQLQTLQKLKQQEEKQSKLNEMRIQEEAFEKHLQNVLKGNSNVQSIADGAEKEVEFVANDGSKIEVINLDGNDSRSPTPDRDRYNKRRRSSRSRSPRDRGRDRRRRSTSRSRVGGSRSPKSNRRRNSRERDRGKEKERDKEKEKEREYERERRRKGLPDIKKDHLSVCSTTLWVGHLSKLVQQEELSDTFGKYGDIVSIDMIHPRGCAFIVMNRRQDAHKAMGSLKSYKMQGRAITISWAAGKGVKSKEWKDYWDLDLGVSYIPWIRIGMDTDLIMLEEGGMFDEDSMPEWIKMKLNQKKDSQDKILGGGIFGMDGMTNVDTTQPPPSAGGMMPGVPMVPPFAMGPVPRLMPPMGVPLPGSMVPGIPMPPNMVPPGMPPPHMMMPPAGMVPGFGPMPHMDKSIPPPNAGPPDNPSMPPPFMGNLHMPPMQHQPPFGNMGMPPQFNPQPHQQPNPIMPPVGGNHQNDDHMDIEMEDENPMNAIKPPPAINFNQPPPMFQPNFNMNEMPGGMGNDNRKMDRDDGRDNNNHRERNDFPNPRERGSRWGNERSGGSRDGDMQSRDRNDNMNDGRPDFNRGRPPPLEQINEIPTQIWRDNGPNFQPPNFGNDNMRRGVVGGGAGAPNIPMDMQNAPPHLRPPPDLRPPPEFFEGRRDEFGMDERRGGGGNGGGGGGQRDFFQNAGNRFGPQPGQGIARGSPMPMRGGPSQPPFGPRLGPMFLRGPSRPGPPAAGFNFGNDRPPFERDERGGGGGNGGGGGGGSGGGGNGGRMRGNNNSMDRRSGGGNWRDDDDGGGGGGGRRGNRFQSRDRDGDRASRDEPKNRDRNERGRGDRGDRGDRERKNERKTTPPAPSGYPRHDNEPEKKFQPFKDSEEDWDTELVERRSTPPPPMGNRRDNSTSKNLQSMQDTEDDWDEELSEHKVEDDYKVSNSPTVVNISPENQSSQHSDDFQIVRNPSPPPVNTNQQHTDIFEDIEKSSQPQKNNESEDNFVMPEEPIVPRMDKQQDEQPASCINTTPLYDEPGESNADKAAGQS